MSGVPLYGGLVAATDELVRDARRLDEARFRSRHGDAFLVYGAMGPAQPAASKPLAPQVENPFDDISTTLNSAEETDGSMTEFFAVAVRRKETSHFEFISVGRHANNDVVIPESSVSKFHAIIKRDTEGRYSLFDGGSTNGTFVNGVAAPTTKDRVKPLPLESGCRVRFGFCELSFVIARDFCEQVRGSLSA